MSIGLWAYLIGVLVMAVVFMVTGAVDKTADEQRITDNEGYRIALLVICSLTWPYQLCVMAYFLVKNGRRGGP